MIIFFRLNHSVIIPFPLVSNIMVKFKRASGILLHIISLPEPNGIGDIDTEAHKFVDFLRTCNQKIWQVSE